MPLSKNVAEFLEKVPDNLKAIAQELTTNIAMNCEVTLGQILVERPNGEVRYTALTVTSERHAGKVSVLIEDDAVAVVLDVEGKPPQGVSRPLAETSAADVMKFVRSIFMGAPS